MSKEKWGSPAKRWFVFMVIAAFAAAISFIQCFQYVAEKTGTGIWIGLGSLFTLIALFCLKKVNDNSDTGMGFPDGK
jgi:hypothetical protein